MSSDFVEIRYTKVFECAEYENGTNILVRTFLTKKVCFFEGGAPKKLPKN